MGARCEASCAKKQRFARVDEVVGRRAKERPDARQVPPIHRRRKKTAATVRVQGAHTASALRPHPLALANSPFLVRVLAALEIAFPGPEALERSPCCVPLFSINQIV